MTDHGSLTGLTDDDHTQYLLKSVIDAKGDLYVASADNVLARLPIGTNGQVLTADSAQSLGVKWATAPQPWFSSDLVRVDRAFASQALTPTTVTASATPHTKGAYAEVITATSGAATMLRVKVGGTSLATTITSTLLDIATGGAGSEVDIISNLNIGASGTFGTASPEFWFPIAVPAGTRISARIQGAVVSGVASVHVTTFNGTNKTVTGVDSIGVVTASSRGTQLTSSSTANTKGSYVQLSASTSHAYTGLLVALAVASNNVSAKSHGTDLATGAAASEVVIPGYSDMFAVFSTAETVLYLPILPILNVSIASGTRIAARTANSTSGAEVMDIAAYGLY